jgi:DMSO reductase iron-sulfur subunit
VNLLPLDAGEQYRFTFSMEACVGCHSCEVACAEQNGNPVGVNWRKVGELEAGAFPDTRRFNLSMACNHCLEPTCLSGCPTNAYVKLENGVVKHQADSCIGCQYCIWNCPYEVPVFNHERRIVTKCDMCLPRLDAGLLPACVEACPTRAINVEPVNVAAWREDHAEADAPGLPSSSITLSTTRVMLPAQVPVTMSAVGDQRVEPEDAHWPLVVLTLLTQLALGTVAASVALDIIGADATRSAVASLGAGLLALGASLLHLGRPVHAWRALANLRRSWLSREVALFLAFAAAAAVHAACGLVGGPTVVTGLIAVAIGGAGVYASGRLYLVPARPVWNSPRTLVAFYATAMALGPLAALVAAGRRDAVLIALAAAGTVTQLLVYSALIERVASRHEREYRNTARLLFGRFRLVFLTRVAMAVLTCALLVGAVAGSALLIVAMCVAAIGELLGRYLFYVTVTPMSAARGFFG